MFENAAKYFERAAKNIWQKQRNVQRLLTLFVPVSYSPPFKWNNNQQIIKSFGLQRSGQHVVIEWISRGLIDVVHLNHCRFYPSAMSFALTPVTGRRIIYSKDFIDDSGIQGRKNFSQSLPAMDYHNLLYSLEDVSLTDAMVQRLDGLNNSKTILILRDPANWLASSIRHNRSSEEDLINKRDLFIQYLEQATLTKKHIKDQCVSINYNQFILNKEYRKNLAQELNLVSFERAEEAISHTPNFGKGSSFINNCNPGTTFERWKVYKNNGFFRKVLNNKKLINLSNKFFKNLPVLNDL